MLDAFEDMTPNQRRALRKGLAALEIMADLWAAEVRLSQIAERIASLPDAAERAKRIAAMTHLAFVEGAYRHYLDHKDAIEPLIEAAQQPEPDMVWPKHDTEQFYHSLDDAVEGILHEDGLTAGQVLSFECAARLADVRVKVISVDCTEERQSVEWEFDRAGAKGHVQ